MIRTHSIFHDINHDKSGHLVLIHTLYTYTLATKKDLMWLQKICYIATFNINTLKIKCACLAFPLDNNDNNKATTKNT